MTKMAETVKDGGSAFPAMAVSPAGDVYHDEGMSLRDWFAGQALSGRMARASTYYAWADAAKDAYEAADAMLAERSKAPGEAQ